jgi:hypothetical protein
MISSALGLPFPLGLPLLMLLPTWLGYLIMGMLILLLLALAGFVLARLGFKPLWSLLLIVPFAQVVVVWALALCRWPRAQPPQE